MPKKRILLFAVIGLTTAILTTLILHEQPSSLPAAPVGVTFIGMAGSTENGVLHFGPTFVLTNHTSRVLVVIPSKIEVRDRTNWKSWNYFAMPEFLVPHGVAYETIDFVSQQYELPTNTWRLRMIVDEKSDGPGALLLKLRAYPIWLWRRGNTNSFAPPNPFTK